MIKYTEIFDWKIYFNNEKLNFHYEKLKKSNYIKENSKLLENYGNFLSHTKILKYDKKENLMDLDPKIFFILFLFF